MMPNIEKVLNLLSEKAIAEAGSVNLDMARERYVLRKTTVENIEEFEEEIGKYYGYHQLHSGGTKDRKVEVLPSTEDKFRHVLTYGGKREEFETEKGLFTGGALDILEKAYTSRGGWKGAFLDAKNGTNGGLKAVIDTIYKTMKQDWLEKYVNHIIRSNIDDDTYYEDCTELMRQYLERYRQLLPKHLRKGPPELLVGASPQLFKDILISHATLMSRQD